MKKILFVIAFSVASLYASSLQDLKETQRNLQKYKQECDANNLKSCFKLFEIRGISDAIKVEEYKQYEEKIANLCNDAETCLKASDLIAFDEKRKWDLLMRACDEFNHIETCKKLPRILYKEYKSGPFPQEYKKYIVHYKKKNCDAGTFVVYAKVLENDCARAAASYYYGDLVDKNIDEALKYYSKACDVVQDKSRDSYCSKIASHYETIEKEKKLLDRDYSQVLKWYEKACAISSKRNGYNCNACNEYNRVKKLWEGK